MTQNSDVHTIVATPIEGLLIVNLPLHGDERGWFKEHWQRDKMVALGLPDFRPVQQNISFNSEVGTTRGFHAEPWDKYVSVINGRAFGAWVDLREGPSFGTTYTAELTPGLAVFVPRGVANSFQTLESDVTYSYLVNQHWSPDSKYVFVNLGDPELGVQWPISLEAASLSEKDKLHPFLTDVTPMKQRKIVVLGANGQLGRALRFVYKDELVDFLTRDQIDLAEIEDIDSFDWSDVGTIINAAAHTAVDLAETPDGRRHAWQVNVVAVGKIADICIEHDITYVGISTDYVFDGTFDPHLEDEALSPLGVYGQTKAAGDQIAQRIPHHYILRTSWVIGDGANFVRTMLNLGERGVDPTVIDDQTGRLTFATEVAECIQHLLSTHAPFGVYNLSSGGEAMSWFEIARSVFKQAGHNPDRVKPISSIDYQKLGSDTESPRSPRPQKSYLSLDKIRQTGFYPTNGVTNLEAYISNYLRNSMGS